MNRYQAAMFSAPWLRAIFGVVLLMGIASHAPAQQITDKNMTVPQEASPEKSSMVDAKGMEWSDSGSVDHIASPFPKPAPPDTRVRVTVLDVSPTLERAGQVAVLLTRFRKRDLEAQIGMKVQLANLSGFSSRPERVDVLYYRPGFMRAAMLIAKAIPGEQDVAPMKPALEKKDGIDVEIVLGPKAL